MHQFKIQVVSVLAVILLSLPHSAFTAVYQLNEPIRYDYTDDYGVVDTFRRTLGHHEWKKKTWPLPGYWRAGHTIQKHVKKSERWLIDRCKKEKHIPLAGTYRYMSHASKVVRQMVKDQTYQIQKQLILTSDGAYLPQSRLRSSHYGWLKHSIHGGIGRAYDCKKIRKGQSGAYLGKVNSAILRVRHSTRLGANYQGGRWYIVTSYPAPN